MEDTAKILGVSAARLKRLKEILQISGPKVKDGDSQSSNRAFRRKGSKPTVVSGKKRSSSSNHHQHAKAKARSAKKK